MNQPGQTQEDRDLIERASRRDPVAFEALVTRYRSRVWGLALRMMQDSSEAEEVLQETFFSAWQSLPAFRGESAFGSWLYRICANFCLMRLRRKKTEAKDESLSSLPTPRFDSEGTLLTLPSYDWSRGTEEKVLDHELRVAIESGAARLPAEYRTVFLLRDVEGMTYEEIAEATASTVSAVKSRLHRARLALREAIDDFYQRPGRARASP